MIRKSGAKLGFFFLEEKVLSASPETYSWSTEGLGEGWRDGPFSTLPSYAVIRQQEPFLPIVEVWFNHSKASKQIIKTKQTLANL